MAGPSSRPPAVLLAPTPPEGMYNPMASLIHDARGKLAGVMGNLGFLKDAFDEEVFKTIDADATTLDQSTSWLLWNYRNRPDYHPSDNTLAMIQHKLDFTSVHVERVADPDLEEVRCDILKAIEEFRSLIEKARLLSQSKFPEEEPSTGDLTPLVQSITDSFRNQYPNVRFDVSADENCRAAFGSKGIQRVLDNLIRNAAEALPKAGGEVSVQLKIVDYEKEARPFEEIKVGSYVMITVRDNGSGIPKRVLAALENSSLTTKKGGCGLGLFGARNTLNQYEGHLFIESKPGKGAKVTALIPSRHSRSQKCIPPRKST